MQELPKALLPVASRPVISYVLELLEQNDLKNAIVVSLYLFLITVLRCYFVETEDGFFVI